MKGKMTKTQIDRLTKKIAELEATTSGFADEYMTGRNSGPSELSTGQLMSWNRGYAAAMRDALYLIEATQ